MDLSAFLLIINTFAEVTMVVLIAYLVKRGNHYKAHRNRLLREKEVMLDYVHDVGEAFADAENIDLDLFLERILFYSMRTTKAGAGAIFMVEPETESLRARAVAGIFPPLSGSIDILPEEVTSDAGYLENLVRSQHVSKGKGLLGETADFGVSILIEDAERDARVPRYNLEYLKINSIILIPMRFRNRVLGVLVVINRTDGNPFSQENQDLLEGLAAQASTSAHFISLRETIEAKHRMDHDLNVARNIQASLLPANIPQVEGFEIAGFSRPALAIGGDYYDVIRIDDKHIGLSIADVSGKGISGAILMSSCRAVLRAQAHNNLDATAVLKEVNDAMSEDISEDMFISMLYMILNVETRNLSIVRAGHTPPLILRGVTGEMKEIDAKGIAIGLTDSKVFNNMLKEGSIVLEPGDCVVAYTDGITEAMDPSGNEWGLNALQDAIRMTADKPAESILANITERIAEFTGNGHQYDDMTMMALKTN